MGRRCEPPLTLRFSMNLDRNVEPEFNANREGIMVFHDRPAIPRGITATGSVVVYLLRELLPRSGPPLRTFSNLTQRRRYTGSARKMFYRCFRSLVWVESLLGSAQNPDAAELFRQGTVTDQICSAARYIARFLTILQNPVEPAERCCLRCNRRPMSAPVVESSAHSLDVVSVHTAGNMNYGSKATLTVSILPPAWDFDPPM